MKAQAATPAGSTGTTALLVVLCLAQFMLILDVAVVAVAIPSIQDDLAVAAADLQWISTAYALAFGGFLIVAGRAADLWGARRLFLVGVFVFVVASLGCGLAQDTSQLLLARGAQGLGAAIVSPAALALLTGSFPEGAERNRALGVWGAVASGGAVAGQLLGGLITDLLDWRWIFLINIPIGIGVIVLGIRLLAYDRSTTSGRLDLVGAVLLTGGLVLSVFAISSAAERGVDTIVTASGLAGLLALLAFVAVERLVAEPIVRFGLFANRHVRYGNIISMLNAATVGVVVFLTTLYLQRVVGLSPLQVGLGFAPVTLSIAVVSSYVAKVIGSLGLRMTLLSGTTLMAVGVRRRALLPGGRDGRSAHRRRGGSGLGRRHDPGGRARLRPTAAAGEGHRPGHSSSVRGDGSDRPCRTRGASRGPTVGHETPAGPPTPRVRNYRDPPFRRTARRWPPGTPRRGRSTLRPP